MCKFFIPKISEKTVKNYQCKNCGRQFLESYSPKGYSQELREACITCKWEIGGVFLPPPVLANYPTTGTDYSPQVHWDQHWKQIPSLVSPNLTF